MKSILKERISLNKKYLIMNRFNKILVDIYDMNFNGVIYV